MYVEFFFGLFTGIVVALVFSLFILVSGVESRSARALEIGHAQYNQITGEFEYTDADLKYVMTGER